MPHGFHCLGREVSDTQTGSGAVSSTQAYNDNGEMHTMSGTYRDTFNYYNSSGSDAGTLKQLTGTGPYAYAVYDSDGNRTCQGGSLTCTSANDIQFTYDAEDRMTVANWGSSYGPLGSESPQLLVGPHETYSYDGNRELAETHYTYSSSSTQQNLTWNTALGGTPSLAAMATKSDGAATGHTDFIDGPDGSPLEQVLVNGSTQTPDWYYTDFAGNTRVLLDSSGNIDQTYNSDAWGNVTTGTTTSGPTTPLIFKDTYIDTTGPQYMQARWYDPTTGQFMNQDPMVQQTLQPYAYAGDNPTGAADPTGQCLVSLHGGGGYYFTVPPAFKFCKKVDCAALINLDFSLRARKHHRWQIRVPERPAEGWLGRGHGRMAWVLTCSRRS